MIEQARLSLVSNAVRSRFHVPIGRQAWFDGRSILTLRLAFIDETGASTKMARRHGRVPRGQTLRPSVPYGQWTTTTFVGVPAIIEHDRPEGPRRPMNAGGPAHLEQVLVSSLKPGDIVIVDNLAAHNRGAVGHHRSRRRGPGDPAAVFELDE